MSVYQKPAELMKDGDPGPLDISSGGKKNLRDLRENWGIFPWSLGEKVTVEYKDDLGVLTLRCIRWGDKIYCE